MREAYLNKDRMERFNLKRAWFVVAWRLVNKEGQDLVQPWFRTKRAARDLAKRLDIKIIGELT